MHIKFSFLGGVMGGGGSANFNFYGRGDFSDLSSQTQQKSANAPGISIAATGTSYMAAQTPQRLIPLRLLRLAGAFQ